MQTDRLLFVGLFAFAAVAAPGTPAVGAPNIVLIMADDLGWSDTSNTLTNMNHPSDYYETPMLEKLASEGMAFTNAYTNGPNCAPTRAAILSGQYAQRPTNNVYLVGSLNRGGSDALLVGPPQGVGGDDAIPTSTYTYAENLQQNTNYATAHFGKFHVTQSAALIVSDHGFDANFGGSNAGSPGAYHASGGTFVSNIGPELDPYAGDYTQQYVNDNIKPYATDLASQESDIDALVGTAKHVTDAMTDAAIDYMKQEKNGNFLVQYHPYAVHSPIGNDQARDDLLAKYQSKTPGTEDTNASFGALIEGLDQSVARLVDYLQTTPDPNNPGQTLDQNTLVIFYSDNGGKQSQSNNGPLKGEKGELDEGGIRVPLIAWSGNPNLVDGGTVNNTPVAGIDFYPTIAALSGAGLPGGVTLDGVDISGLFADASATIDRDALYWHLPGYLIDSSRDQRPQSVIRSGDWKLLYNYEDQTFELYDLAADIGESTNVADANPQVVGELGLQLMHWLKDTDAPLATLRTGTLELNFTGSYYQNGEILQNSGTLQIQAGQEVPLILGDFLSLADLNRDSLVNAADWLLFRGGQGADLTGLTPEQAFSRGDLDGDFDNDLADFVAFRNAWELKHGVGSFADATQVPEPVSALLAMPLLLAKLSAKFMEGKLSAKRFAALRHRR